MNLPMSLPLTRARRQPAPPTLFNWLSITDLETRAPDALAARCDQPVRLMGWRVGSDVIEISSARDTERLTTISAGHLITNMVGRATRAGAIE